MKLVIRAGKATDDLLRFAADHPTHVRRIESSRITGESAEFIALVTLAGVGVKAISDLALAYLTKHKDIEISCNGVSVKGIDKDSAFELIDKLVKDAESDGKPS